MRAETKEQLHEILLGAPTLEWVRVPQKLARTLLLGNSSMISKGSIYYFQIRNLGLGVCEVCLAPLGAKETRMVK